MTDKDLNGAAKNNAVILKQITDDWWPDILHNNTRMKAAWARHDWLRVGHLLWAYNTSTIKHLYRVWAFVWPVALVWWAWG